MCTRNLLQVKKKLVWWKISPSKPSRGVEVVSLRKNTGLQYVDKALKKDVQQLVKALQKDVKEKQAEKRRQYL